MSDDLEVRFSMSRKRRGSYDVEYMRIVVGLIRDGIGAKSLARRLGVSKETTREWLLSYRIGGEAALMGEREGNRKYDYETKLAAVLDHLERGMSCFASMFVRQVRQCFSAVWADGFPRCRHRFPVM